MDGSAEEGGVAELQGIVAKLDVATMRNIKAGSARYCSPRHKVPL